MKFCNLLNMKFCADCRYHIICRISMIFLDLSQRPRRDVRYAEPMPHKQVTLNHFLCDTDCHI